MARPCVPYPVRNQGVYKGGAKGFGEAPGTPWVYWVSSPGVHAVRSSAPHNAAGAPGLWPSLEDRLRVRRAIPCSAAADAAAVGLDDRLREGCRVFFSSQLAVAASCAAGRQLNAVARAALWASSRGGGGGHLPISSSVGGRRLGATVGIAGVRRCMCRGRCTL